MPARSVIFENEFVYHVFNRGVEKRKIFEDKCDYRRFLKTIDYYRFSYNPVGYNQLMKQNTDKRQEIIDEVKRSKLKVEILAYCLMSNHFHILIRQKMDDGIRSFLANISNGHSCYFNKRHKRSGSLFQGRFRAVLIESEEQLIHVSRYIHLNPVVSLLVHRNKMDSYLWSSLSEYTGGVKLLTETETVLSCFKDIDDYKSFLLNQVDYARQLEIQKHLCID